MLSAVQASRPSSIAPATPESWSPVERGVSSKAFVSATPSPSISIIDDGVSCCVSDEALAGIAQSIMRTEQGIAVQWKLHVSRFAVEITSVILRATIRSRSSFARRLLEAACECAQLTTRRILKLVSYKLGANSFTMDNTHRFTGRAEDYDRYRQRYPTAEILSHLRNWCGLTPSWLVADIGAGTGMLGEVFLENGNRVLAVEPNADMREQMRPAVEQQLGHPAPHLEVIDATAEETTLAAASIDLVAAGRAFHWFDKDRALAEFRRILKPTGWVTLVAADRDRDSKEPAFRKQMDGYESLMATHGTDYARVRSGYRTYDKMDTFFDGELHQAQISGLRQFDWTSFSGYAKSLSITPQPGHANYEGFERALAQYFDDHAREGILTMPTICWITAARFSTRSHSAPDPPD